MKRMLKLLVPVLVLAMLIQVPFALNASASTLSNETSYQFTLTKAEDTAPGNVAVKLTATTDENELITTFGATLVLDATKYDFVNQSGEVITDNYKKVSAQLGTGFPITASAFDEGEGFDFISACSLISYNATNEKFYVFISGLSALGLTVPAGTEVASFYIQAKDGIKPAEDNVRVMALSEYKDTAACPSNAIVPGEISSKTTVFKPTAEDIITNVSIVFDFAKQGSVNGLNAIKSDNIGTYAVDVTVTLANADNTYTATTKAEQGFSFDAVEEGTYTITITAPGSLGYTINNVVVEADKETVIPEIYLLFGDVDANGSIAPKDVSDLLTVYGTNLTAPDINNVDGDDVIGPADLSIMLLGDHYGSSTSTQVIDL